MENGLELFVLIPFREEPFSFVYEKIKETAIANGFRCLNAAEIEKPGIITDKVIREIFNCDAIIADISEYNPNVLYELGVAHSFRKPTILLSQNLLRNGRLNIDLQGAETIGYSVDVNGLQNLSGKLRNYLKAIKDEHEFGNPVANALKGKKILVSDFHDWLWGALRTYKEEERANTIWEITSNLYFYDVDRYFSCLYRSDQRFYVLIPDDEEQIERAERTRYDMIKSGKINSSEQINKCLMFIPIDKKYFGLWVVYLVIYDGNTKDVRGYIAEPMCSHVGEDKAYDEYILNKYTQKQKITKLDIFGETTFDIKLAEDYAQNLAIKFTLLWNSEIERYEKNKYLKKNFSKEWLVKNWKI